MKRFIRLVAAVLALHAAPAGAASIAISCGAIGLELELCREGAEAWAAETGHEVEIVSTPNSTSDRLALYQQMLAAGAADIDVYQIDVVWPGILGEHFVDLTPYTGGAEAAHFPASIENNTAVGALKAMPWFVDVGLLYYRSDLLDAVGADVPQTWREMADIAARAMEGQEGLWGYVFQGKAYEGLTCNALEWVASHGGGTVVDASGEITIDNPAAATALEKAAGWIGSIAPQGVLAYTEEEARALFQSGRAVFMRNWPYAWPLLQGEDSPVRGKIGVAPLPMGPGGSHAATLGGYQLAVSRYSQNPKIAADLVMYLTSPAEQKRRAIKGAFNPTIPELYDDPEVLEAVPFFADLREIVAASVARPSAVTGQDYNKVSSAFWEAVHGVLSGRTGAEAALSRLSGELKRIRRRGWSG